MNQACITKCDQRRRVLGPISSETDILTNLIQVSGQIFFFLVPTDALHHTERAIQMHDAALN